MRLGPASGIASLIPSVPAFALARLFEPALELVGILGRMEEQIQPCSEKDPLESSGPS